ncbi:MAG: NAD(P)/FAD-dependent oxidoreductase [Coraliomargaritaceae bacterium]
MFFKEMNPMGTDVLIIGAGISGLLAATELRRQGYSVCLLDKGRGVGGRMSTRRMQGARLDHGAQFFTVRDQRFQAYVDEWLDAGVVREWFRHLPGENDGPGHPRYCGINGMNAVPKWLARDLDVHSSERVNCLIRNVDQWVAQTESGDSFSASHLIVTTPLPQALLLLETAGLDWANGDLQRLRAVRYEMGLATMVILDGPSEVPAPGGMKLDRGHLSWIADNRMKGISPDVNALTLHATAEFARAHWNSPDAVRGPRMIGAAELWLGSRVVDYACHRWGFTLPLNPWPKRFYQNTSLNLVLAGDAFGGPRVEGAVLSGIEAAATIGQLV